MNATIRVINDMVAAGVISRYAVAGAVAAIFYLEPVLTSDLDILISVDEMKQAGSGLATIKPLLDYLTQAGYADFKEEGILVEGWPVQFLPVASDLDAEALDQAVDVEMDNGAPVRVTILRAEHLVAIALRTGRDKDHLRIKTFLDHKKVDFRALAGVYDRHDLWDAWAKFCRKAGLDDAATLELRT
jgi:hypothetical protein